jgi:serine O-acetyltransferase
MKQLSEVKRKLKSVYQNNRWAKLFLFVPVSIYSNTMVFYKKKVLEAFYSYKFFKSTRLHRLNDLTIGIKKLGVQKTKFPHPIGIVIGIGVQIGKNCTIYQNVTIGAKSQKDADNGIYPKIGHNVTIGCNAVIIGNIEVGDNVKIGACTLVNCDIPHNVTVVGNPCRIIKKI